MTVIRKLGEFFGSLIFSISLGLLIVFIALANFTQYNTLQPIIAGTIGNQLAQSIQPDQLQIIYLNLTGQCSTSSIAIVPLGNNTEADLKCDDVKASQASDVPNLIAENLFNQTYYKNYSCDFISCLQGLSFQTTNIEANQKYEVILSAKSNEFFTSNQIYLIGLTVAGVILIIVSVRTFYKIFKIIGVTLLFIGIPYLFIPILESFIANQFQGINASPIVDTLFNSIGNILKISLIAGIILTAAGYIFAFLLKHDEKPKEEQKKSADVV